MSASAGGSWLITPLGSTPQFTGADFSEEDVLYATTAEEFVRNEVLPQLDAIEAKQEGLMPALLKRAGALGLLMIDVPEAYGGLGLRKTTSMLVSERGALCASFSVSWGAHTGIGTLPIVYYGTEAQKQRYLPKLATGEWLAAYALTEPQAGSDALAARTRAVLEPDGRTYRLTGTKQFITNAGFADLFTVFAKVDGEKFTGFIVDRATPGFTVGAEEHKMGIRGSSTCSLVFEDAKVPAENLLGEIGKGHKIAFNILNLGRLKLGVGVLGAMKLQLANTLAYAAERKQFNTPLVRFGLIREKLARMCGLVYALESMAYRTSGLIDSLLESEDKAASDYAAKGIAAIEEFAIESSILKVFGSEALGVLVDDAVQVHGGYGYIQEYPVVRAYRDARIIRIFEGTNEINRMLVVGMLLKRAMKGMVPLFEFAQSVDEELSAGALPKPKGDDQLSKEAHAAELLKRIAAYSLKVAAESFGPELEKQQVVLANLADIITDAYALDSMVARTRQCAEKGQLDPTRVAIARAFANQSNARSLECARRVVCASAKEPQPHLDKLSRLSFFQPVDPVALIETVAKAVEDARGYPFAVV